MPKNLVSSRKVPNFALAFGTEVTGKTKQSGDGKQNQKKVAENLVSSKIVLNFAKFSANAEREPRTLKDLQ